MKPATQAMLAVGALVILLGAGWWLRPYTAPVIEHGACGELTNRCSFRWSDHAIGIEVDHPPAVLKSFQLNVTGYAGKTLTARFSMVGMEMGPIAFPLKQQADGRFAASMMLPYCVQGRRDWVLRLEGDDGTADVTFLAAK
ncbi:MAG: hypothetical protein JO142_18910 [Burkholderiales bacterium]|nr:hypothetical protein [Burkholderiales bacterium]